MARAAPEPAVQCGSGQGRHQRGQCLQPGAAGRRCRLPRRLSLPLGLSALGCRIWHVVLGAGITDVGEYLFNDVFKTVFYAQPGTPGYASGEALVADLNSRKGAQVSLQAYTPLSVELDAAALARRRNSHAHLH